jgi:cytoskeletal protein CcmA (bactofilin family)
MEEIEESNYSLLGRKCNFKGEFTVAGKTYIHSTIEGKITSIDQETIVLEFHALVTGTIKAHDIIIFGSFHGDLKSTGKVVLRPTAKVTGSISCTDLIVMPGAFLDAQIETETRENL